MPKPAQPAQPATARQIGRARRRRRGSLGVLAATRLVLVCVLLTSCAATTNTAGRLPAQSSYPVSHPESTGKTRSAAPTHAPTTGPAKTPAAAASTALAALAKMQVKGRAPKTGYSRTQFGHGWASVDGCDTRDRILRRDLILITIQAGTNGCRVLSGQLADPYTGRTIDMKRGLGDPVQIDHVAALSDSWQTGAQAWTARRREAFANDPLNLLAVDGPANESKGDGDAATWLPPDKSYRCLYIARQISIKAKYGLWLTAAEKSAMTTVLRRCPTQRITTEPPA